MITDWIDFDWEGARYNENDLVPGDPESVAALGSQMKASAAAIAEQVKNLRNLTDGEGWDSPAGQNFQQKVGDTADTLDKVQKRYEEVATALGSSVRRLVAADTMSWKSGSEWASTLELAQVKAQDAIRRGQAASGESTATQKKIVAANSGSSPAGAPSASQLTQQKGVTDADMGRAGSDLQDAMDLRDREGRAVASAINDVIDHDGLKNSQWAWLEGAIADIGHIAGVVAGVLGMIVFIAGFFVGISEILVIALAVVSVIALVADTVSAMDGKGTWLDVAIDAIGVLSLGMGEAVGGGLRGAADASEALEGSYKGIQVLTGLGLDLNDAVDLEESVNDALKSGKALNTLTGSWFAGMGKTLLKLGLKAPDSSEVLDALKSLKGPIYGGKSALGFGSWFASQAGALTLGVGNLGPAFPFESGLPWANMFDGLKKSTWVGANGIPGVNWKWHLSDAG